MKKTNSEEPQNENKEYNNFFDEADKNIRELDVSFIGDSGVGKSCIISQLVGGKFNEFQQQTIGVDFYTKTVPTDNQTIKVRIWDLAGQEKYSNIIRSFYKNPFVFLVYSVTDKNSFNNLGGWLEDVKNKNSNARFLLVGNKIDVAKERKTVTTEEGDAFAKKHEMRFVEVSAKTGEKIEDGLFTLLINKFLEEEKKEEKISKNSSAKDYEGRNSNSFFCDECCSSCPCFKSSEDNLLFIDDVFSLK